jgi:hypothetical protein
MGYNIIDIAPKSALSLAVLKWKFKAEYADGMGCR